MPKFLCLADFVIKLYAFTSLSVSVNTTSVLDSFFFFKLLQRSQAQNVIFFLSK